jgi:hypothetical protein
MSETQNNIHNNDVNENVMNENQNIDNKNITNEFCKIIGEFVPDLFNTFPECKENLHPGIIVALEHAQFMKENHRNNSVNDDDDKNEQVSSENIENNEDFQDLMDSCKQVYPTRFFDILYQNDEIFSNSEVDTHFLPNINFSELWAQDISAKTREVIWKYLQLILLALMPSINDGNSFGDTAKLFEAIDEEEFKKKLEETVESMNSMFNFDGESDNNGNEASSSQPDGSSNPINLENLPNADELHNHINGMLGGKLGKLAQEIAEETANELDIDLENATNVNDVFKKLFKNPGKLMSMVKNIGGKLESKIKSGEISETELMKEASSMMGEMHKMPGMNNIKSMLQQFGLPTGKGKFNMNAFQSHMNQNIKGSQQRERMLKKLEQRKKERGEMNNDNETTVTNNVFSKGEAPQKSTRSDRPKNKNNKGKRKKNKNKK